METKRLFAVIVVLLGLATVPAYSQFPPPAAGNESTPSFGGFKILVDPHAASHFTGCPANIWDGHYLSSPTLYDPATIIGVSAVTTGTSATVGAPPAPPTPPTTTVGDTSFVHPPAGFSGPGPRIYTQIRSLNLNTYSGTPPVTVSLAPTPPSAGEVRPAGATANSFFEVYVHITIPSCLPGATLYNKTHEPLIVEASGLTSLPPSVVYNHMVSSEVPIYIRVGRKEEFVGCIVLAAHEVGVAGTPQGGGGGKGGPGKGKGPQKEMPAQSERGREELEKQKAAFEAHMKEAERGMPHNCKVREGAVKAQ